MYHELVFIEAGEQLEDKIFFVIGFTDVRGELVERFEGGRNAWMSEAVARSQPKIFNSFDEELAIMWGEKTWVELRQDVTKEAF